MAYDDSRFRSETAYRDDPDAGRRGLDDPAAGYPPPYAPTTFGGEGFAAPDTAGPAAPTADELGNVFDDPAHGDPGRDRVSVHLLWEAVLLVFAASLFYLLRDSAPAALRGTAFKELLLFGTVIGLLATGAGMTFRAAVPNLALGPVAYACAMFFADRSDRGLTATALVTAGVAVGLGLALAVMVVAFHVPSWAASLGVAFAVMVWLERQHEVTVVAGAFRPAKQALLIFAAYAGLSVLAGLLGLIRPLRRVGGRFRPVADPAARRGVGAGVVATLAIVGSMVLAAAAGVLLALDTRPLPAGQSGLSYTGLAIGAALLGGTSVFGRRGGVFGSLLAVVLLVLLVRYGDAQQWNLSPLAVGSAAILVGLVVSRLIEAFGRPRSGLHDPLDPIEVGAGQQPADWTATTAGPDASPEDWATGSRSGGWTTQMPARPADDAWGTPDRWRR